MAPFISSADLAAYLKSSEAGLNSDLALIAVDAACDVVEGYCGQQFDSQTVTDEWVDGSGSASLILPAYPATVTALSVYTDKTDTAPEVLVLDTDYVVKRSGMVKRIDGGKFPLGDQNVKVSYTYGYATIPSSVRIVALQVAARIYDVGMVESSSGGGVSATYVKGAGSLTRDEKDNIRRFKV